MTLAVHRAPVQLFIDEAKDDLQSPTTSTFAHKIPVFRDHVGVVAETLDFDAEGLQKLRKSVKSLQEAGASLNEAEIDMIQALDTLARLNDENSTANDVYPEITTAFLKFCVIFRDLSLLTKGLVQSMQNNLVFPLDNLLKNDMKDKSELKKSVEKSLKDYEGKQIKAEKELKHLAKESGFTRGAIGPSELAEELSKERTQLQYQICKFFLLVNKISDKKSVELLQHLIDYYHTQESYYRDGLKSVEEYRCYLEDLVGRLNQIKQRQDKERKELHELKDLLRGSPHLELSHAEKGQAMNTSIVASAIKASTSSDTETTGEVFLGGILLKRSANKLHKHWQKRKCAVRDGCFYLAHSDETKPAVEIKLLTCAVKEVPEEKKCFDLVTRTRTYNFQADTEANARKWIAVIRNVARIEGPSNALLAQADARMKDLLLRVPGNKFCADCGSDRDVTWVSKNLGAVVCIECSGAHRELGVHVSRIQSIDLDTFSKVELLVPLAIGNQALNRVFEATLPVAAKLEPSSSSQERKQYIEAKYVDRRYVKHSEDPRFCLKQAANKSDISFLLKAFATGFDFNTPMFENSGDSILMALVRSDEEKTLAMIEFLMQNGADPGRQNSSGDTAIHICVQTNRPEYLELLLAREGVKKILDVQNKKGKTPNQIAAEKHLVSCQKILEAATKGIRMNFNDFEIPRYLLQDLPQDHSGRDSHLYSSASRNLALRDHMSLATSGLAPLANTTTDDDSDSMCSSANSPYLPIRGRVPPTLPASLRLENNGAIKSSTKIEGGGPYSEGSGFFEFQGKEDNNLMHKRSMSESERLTTTEEERRFKTEHRQTLPAGSSLPGARKVLPPPPSANVLHAPVVRPDVRNQMHHVVDNHVEQRYQGGHIVGASSIHEISVENLRRQPPTPAPRKTREGGSFRLQKRCRALYDCHGDHEDELNFSRGDVIVVTRENIPEEADNTWMEGYVEGISEKKGIFPVSFVTFTFEK